MRVSDCYQVPIKPLPHSQIVIVPHPRGCVQDKIRNASSVLAAIVEISTSNLLFIIAVDYKQSGDPHETVTAIKNPQ